MRDMLGIGDDMLILSLRSCNAPAQILTLEGCTFPVTAASVQRSSANSVTNSGIEQAEHHW
jgi:hypothetical protein